LPRRNEIECWMLGEEGKLRADRGGDADRTFGWTLGITAERMAREQAHTAVVAVLAPICVEKFQHQADAATKLNEFKRVPSWWDRRSIIEKGGWATMPGTDAPSSAIVTACAERLGGAL
jgi:hypothetical protein